jgi:hypothetical protein
VKRRRPISVVHEPRLAVPTGRRTIDVSIASVDGGPPYVAIRMVEPSGWVTSWANIPTRALRAIAAELVAIAAEYEADPGRPVRPDAAVATLDAEPPEPKTRGDIPW